MALGDAFPGVSGGPDSVEARKALAGLVIRDTAGNARPGIFPRHANALLVARADLRVDILGFEGVSVRGGGTHFMANDGVVQSQVLTVPASNSILHVIYFKQNESAAPFSDANNLPIIGVLSSAAAAIPVKPDISTVPGAVELGTVLMPSGKTATNQSGVVITATHQFTTTAGGILWFRTASEMNAATTLPPQTRALNLAEGNDYYWDGDSWERVGRKFTAKQVKTVDGVSATINVLGFNPLPTIPLSTAVVVPPGSAALVKVTVRFEGTVNLSGSGYSYGIRVSGATTITPVIDTVDAPVYTQQVANMYPTVVESSHLLTLNPGTNTLEFVAAPRGAGSTRQIRHVNMIIEPLD